jgi:hypothetical protein
MRTPGGANIAELFKLGRAAVVSDRRRPDEFAGPEATFAEDHR